MHTTTSSNPAGEPGKEGQDEALLARRAALRMRAETILAVPEGYALTIEEYEPSTGRDGAAAMFVWTLPGTDNGITVELGEQGDLLHYSDDTGKPLGLAEEVLSFEELRRRALRFVTELYPDALDRFVPVRDSSPPGGGQLYEYGQMAMDLPLPRSGFRVRIAEDGTVTGFRYFGSQQEPAVPAELVPKEKLLQRLAASTDLRLELSLVTEHAAAPVREKLRLVYRPHPYVSSFEADARKAGEAESLTEESEQEDDIEAAWEEVAVPADEPAAASEPDVLRWAGHDPGQYELLRQAEIDGKTGFVWRRTDYTPAPGVQDALSINSFFHNRNEQTIKAMLNPESGRLVSFMRFDKASGPLCLSREECRDIAVRLINRAAPGLLPYLRLKTDDSREDCDTELFEFRLQIGGVQLETDRIRICINKTTGQPDQFIGLSVGPGQLAGFDPAPRVSVADVKKIYMDSVDLRPEWATDYSDSAPERRYKLTYRLVDRLTGRQVRLIDANSGEPLCF
ncbi:YcdB/YcdC domain-containing protein [Paenibacillus sp. GCM10012303]|uniref:YcdB/YcdC domain-containing protein n=1 Tax=Paenibacillus sp. GCM10012303 TaxID=3317340 RepID=UPI003623000F